MAEKVPESIRTGEDAVLFFVDSPCDRSLVIHCNYRQQEGLEYDPYDLVVVDQKDVKSEYFLVSDRGITHMKQKHSSNRTPHQDWLEERRMFLLLKQTTFFGKNTLVKVIAQTHPELSMSIKAPQPASLDDPKGLNNHYFLR